jgi:hypothetical protein
MNRFLAISERMSVFSKVALAIADARSLRHHGCSYPPEQNHDHRASRQSFIVRRPLPPFCLQRRNAATSAGDQECFKKGDNGVGCWGDDCTEGSGPSCALPPEDMIDKWGSVLAAKHKPVIVSLNGHTVTCLLKDRMPHRANITNGAGIDLNPDAVRAAGLQPPIMAPATWSWAS